MTIEIVDALIHHHFPNPKTGAIDYDNDGDPLLGFYFELKASDGSSMGKMGPYPSAVEAENACRIAWERGDY